MANGRYLISSVDGLSVNYIGPQSYSQTDLNTGKTLSSVSYIFNFDAKSRRSVRHSIHHGGRRRPKIDEPASHLWTVAKAAPVVNPKIF